MSLNQSLKKTAGETLDCIPVEDLRELVAKSRWICDSRRLMAMVAGVKEKLTECLKNGVGL